MYAMRRKHNGPWLTTKGTHVDAFGPTVKLFRSSEHQSDEYDYVWITEDELRQYHPLAYVLYVMPVSPDFILRLSMLIDEEMESYPRWTADGLVLSQGMRPIWPFSKEAAEAIQSTLAGNEHLSCMDKTMLFAIKEYIRHD